MTATARLPRPYSPPPFETLRMAQTLSPQDEAEARRLYAKFWKLYPHLKNPSDINRPEKATFLIMEGFERIALMQRARKLGYDFTRPDEADEE